MQGLIRLLRDPFSLACGLGVLAGLLHLPALSADFVFDDLAAITENPQVTGEAGWSTVFTTNFWGGRPGFEHVTTWRPLTTLGFRLTWLIAGNDPFAFHLVNLLLHGLVVVLVAIFVWRLFADPLAGLVAAGLFAVLPVHVEAVAGAVNRAELQAAVFYLLGLIGVVEAQRGRHALGWALGLVAFAVGLLSKEHVITWPVAAAVAFLYLRGRAPAARQRPPWWVLGATVAIAAAWVGARGIILPSLLGGEIPPGDNPLVEHGFGARLLTVGTLYYHALRVLVAPLRLTVDYSAHAIEIATGLSEPSALAGWLLIAASLWALAAAWRRLPALAVCLGLFALLYGLVSNLLVTSTILFAERLMYLPSVAWCAGLGVIGSYAIDRANQPLLRRGLALALGLVVVGYAVRTVERTAAWRDGLTLFQRSVDAFPDSARARTILGQEYLERGRLGDAEENLLAALVIRPDDPDAAAALGRLRWLEGRYDEALARWMAAFEQRPQRALLPDLCRGLVAAQRYDDAIARCQEALRYFPERAMPRHYLGLAFEGAGQAEQARRVLEEARRIEPANRAILEAIERLNQR